MKFFYFILQTILAIYIAVFVAEQGMKGNYLAGIALFVSILFFFVLSRRWQFIIFSFIIFFSLSFPKSFPLPMNKVVELFAPPLCFLMLIEMLINRKPIFSRKAYIFYAAAGVIALWSVIHYVSNPVLGQITFATKRTAGGLRTYYVIFACMATFLYAHIFFRHYNLDVPRWLFGLFAVVLVIGNLQLLAFIVDFSIPFLRVTSEIGQKMYSNLTLRAMAGLGIPLVLSLFHKRGRKHLFVLFFINLVVFVIFGGGRTNLLSSSFVTLLYIALINRRSIVPVTIVLVLITGIYTVTFTEDNATEETKFRTFQFEGGFKEQGGGRYEFFLIMFEIFKENPVMGKGIGYQDVRLDKELLQENPELQDIVKTSFPMGLTIGGHGAYMSTLLVYGLGGAFWLMVMLYGSMYNAYRMFREGERRKNLHITVLTLFVFLILVRMSIGFLIAGLGYTSHVLWFLAGIISGLKSREYLMETEEREVREAGLNNV